VSDEDATVAIRGCPQQVVRVVLVEFGERRARHTDKPTNGQHYNAACRPSADQSAKRVLGKLNRKIARHARHPREEVGRVREHAIRGCCEETAPVEFKLSSAFDSSARIDHSYHNCRVVLCTAALRYPTLYVCRETSVYLLHSAYLPQGFLPVILSAIPYCGCVTQSGGSVFLSILLNQLHACTTSSQNQENPR